MNTKKVCNRVRIKISAAYICSTVHRAQKIISFALHFLDNFIGDMRFRKIGLALAFSPRMEALMAEALRLKKLWNSELVLIHVGHHGEKEEKFLEGLLTKTGLAAHRDVRIIWASGKPADQILRACKKENVDLLMAGALRKENLVQFYLGTIARKILRQADCCVLMFTDPSTSPQPIKNIVVNAEDSPYVDEAIAAACELGRSERASWLHIVKEVRQYDLALTGADGNSESDTSDSQRSFIEEQIESIEKTLRTIPHQGLKVNIKVVSEKAGFQLAKFTQRKHTDLLVVGASPRRSTLFDRVFPHDLEYIFADLPCNLLIVHPERAS
jgi:nucleotide-binding universal stress UspA family protein